MPRTCSICSHKSRPAIEQCLLSGEAFRNLAKRFGMSPTALFRHKAGHLRQSLQASHAAGEVLRGDALVDHVGRLRVRAEALYGEAESILAEARRAKDLRTCLKAIRSASGVLRESRGKLELLGGLSGELQGATVQAQVTIVIPVADAGTAPVSPVPMPLLGMRAG